MLLEIAGNEKWALVKISVGLGFTPPNNTAQHQKRLKLGLKNYHLMY